jgi:hypothetical protein
VCSRPERKRRRRALLGRRQGRVVVDWHDVEFTLCGEVFLGSARTTWGADGGMLQEVRVTAPACAEYIKIDCSIAEDQS